MGLNNTRDRNIDKKFDFNAPPKKWKWYLRPLAWMLCVGELIMRHSKLKRINTEGVKPPYLLLCTHAAFLDFKVAMRFLFPHRATFVVAIDGFIHREGIMRNIGCIGTRKFVLDPSLVKNLVYSVKNLKQSVVMYPEARYSINGTTAILPPSLGKMAKLMGVPVLVLNTHGHYINSSVWNLKKKKVPIDAEVTQIVDKDEINSLSYQEINDRIKKAFVYDEYAWQKAKGVLVKDKHRAEGLEKVLYKCPHCGAESVMQGKGTILTCGACGKEYEYKEDGTIRALHGKKTEFKRVPEWFEWERSTVREQIENGEYRIEDEVDVDSLPNSKGFINMGKGHFIHDLNGLCVSFIENGIKKLFKKNVCDNYSCHIEFDYNNKGDCVSFSDSKNTYYFHFEKLKNIIVKIHFAVEEMFKLKYPERT